MAEKIPRLAPCDHLGYSSSCARQTGLLMDMLWPECDGCQRNGVRIVWDAASECGTCGAQPDTGERPWAVVVARDGTAQAVCPDCWPEDTISVARVLELIEELRSKCRPPDGEFVEWAYDRVVDAIVKESSR